MTTRRRLRDAMVALSCDRDLYGVYPTTHTDRNHLAIIEAVAHELAHEMEAGRSFDFRLEEARIDNDLANEHEMATLRIEVAALAELGVRVSLRNLWRDAGWRGTKPTLTAARRGLSAREQKCVAAFVRIVREYMEAT